MPPPPDQTTADERTDSATRAPIVGQFRGAYFGPNPYALEPVVIARLGFSPEATVEGPARCAHIARATATWFDAPASFEDCNTPLGIGRFLVGWALSALTAHRGFLHAGVAVEENDIVIAALGFHDPDLSRALLALAVGLFNAADKPLLPEHDKQLQALWRQCHRLHPDYQAAFVMQAARDANIPYLSVLPEFKTWQFGWGARSELTLESLGARDSALGDRVSREKPLSKVFLYGLGVPTPRDVLVGDTQDLAAAAQAVGFPCVVKPHDGGQSVGVLTDIADLDRLKAAVEETLATHGPPAMIETQVPGEVYRILVARGRTVHVVRRAVAHVVGDGRSTVRALIAAENREQAAVRTRLKFVEEIPLDEECLAALARAGVGPDDVLPKGRRVPLRRIPMLTSGAVYTDVTAETHPDTLRMAEMMAASLKLQNCGIDFVTTDISRSITKEGAVLELNTIPSLRVHLAAGLAPDAVGRMILGDGPARVPSALLIAPHDTLVELHRTAAFDETTGWAIGRYAGIGALRLSPQPAAANQPSPTQRAAQTVVRNPLVERVFVAVSLEGIVGTGLPLDRFDTVVCLGCKPDPTWERVLREAGGTYAVAKDLGTALRKCGLPPPPKQAAKPIPPPAALRRRPGRRSPAG